MFKDIKDKLLGRDTAMSSAEGIQPIVMYATRFCPYCMRARGLFEHKGWAFEEISVDGNPELRAEMMEKAGRHTVPQIWIGDQHIGGCDDLFRLEVAGQLDDLVLNTPAAGANE